MEKTNLEFKILQPQDQKLFALIADWYLEEWQLAKEKTVQSLQNITADTSQFQALMTLNHTPIATAGLYNHVGLLDKEPRFKIYEKWLALVYTTPAHRKKGYGALLVNFVQEYSKCLGIEKIYLYTDTAERLYRRLSWIVLDSVTIGERNVVVMTKDLVKPG